MDAAIWGFVGVVVGGLITGLVGVRLEMIRADKAAALDSAKRRDDRRLGRDNFQRETLLALQEAIGEVNGALVAYRLRHEGVMPEPDLPAQYRLATFRVITLRSRVADEAVREAASEFVGAAGTMTRAQDQPARDQAFNHAGEQARIVLERSGELIRATFVEPAA